MAQASFTVRQVMQPDPVAVQANRPLREVLALMNRFRIGAVIVVTPGQGLLGIFTERDLLVRMADVRSRAGASSRSPPG